MDGRNKINTVVHAAGKGMTGYMLVREGKGGQSSDAGKGMTGYMLVGQEGRFV